MRATATALLNVFYGLASAFGPMLFGFLSDLFSTRYGPAQGLAQAMAIGGLIYLWAALHYLLAARRLRADMVNVGVIKD
jgi:MFS family permease